HFAVRVVRHHESALRSVALGEEAELAVHVPSDTWKAFRIGGVRRVGVDEDDAPRDRGSIDEIGVGELALRIQDDVESLGDGVARRRSAERKEEQEQSRKTRYSHRRTSIPAYADWFGIVNENDVGAVWKRVTDRRHAWYATERDA